MIKNLSIRNFKCHQNTEIALSNLTVLTGFNSSGKTSVMQALLLLRQSHQKGKLMEGLDLNGGLCQIGKGNDALCKLSEIGEIEFRMTNEEDETFSFLFDVGLESLGQTFLNKKLYSENIDNDTLSASSLFGVDFQYISAYRLGGISRYPQDSHVVEHQKQISMFMGGGELVAQYLDVFGSNDVEIDTSGGETDLSLKSQTIYWEQRISPNVTFNVNKGDDGSSYLIKYGYNGVGGKKDVRDLAATNVGYGISYTLPVIVALLSARPGALIIIENPEAHLHPAGQAELAKLMTMVARNGAQVIVETHSDHIVNGALVAVKQKMISPEQLSVYYFTRNEEQHVAETYPLGVSPTGRIKNPPKGFFDQMRMDLRVLVGI